MSNPDSPIKISPSTWQKGSEWRRWDLHIHTPESKLGSSFENLTWDEYLDALEKAAKDSVISVIGVTT
jgi:diketogulonate reductase-like aldo/keto reductase